MKRLSIFTRIIIMFFGDYGMTILTNDNNKFKYEHWYTIFGKKSIYHVEEG